MTKRKQCLILPIVVAAAVWILAAAHSAHAQQADAQAQTGATRPVVPQMIRYSGVAGSRAGDTVEISFRIYAAAQGGDAMWSETQTVSIGSEGKYTALLGSATEGGLPDAVFQSGQGRWLGVSIEGAPENNRSVLSSVAYAMKAADAESLAGVSAKEFVTRDQLSAQLASATQALEPEVRAHTEANPSGGGATNTIAMWTSPTALGDSSITQLGTAAAPLVGIGTTTPASTLDVAGIVLARIGIQLPAISTATAAVGSSSPSFTMSASSFKNGGSAVNQKFVWQAVSVGNNTAAPSADLSLLFGSGSSGLVNTGLYFQPSGIVHFATGQTFPGTGPGTITGVTPASPLTGGGTSGNVALGLNTASLEGTLNNVYAQLATANSFTGNQSVTGNLTVGGTETVTGLATFNGGLNSAAALTLPAAVATPTAGGASPNLGMSATGFNSTSSTSVPQTFALSAIPTGNNTATPSANLELLFGSGTTAPAATGLAIAPTGLITFAPGQTFPGTGDITAVNTNSPITGGATSGAVTLGIDFNALETTLNGNYAQLGAANIFSQTQTINQSLNVGGGVYANLVGSAIGYNLGGEPFDTGNYGQLSSSVGFSNSPLETGNYDLGVGYGALAADTTGAQNTAVGVDALNVDADGSQNTGVGSSALAATVGGCAAAPPPPPTFRPGQRMGPAKDARRIKGMGIIDTPCANPEGLGNTGVGVEAGQYNVSGNYNTMVGFNAGPDSASTGLTGATAIGANSTVSQNYSVVLGQTTTTAGALNATVGIGTATPMSALDISVLNSGQLGPTITLTNPSYAGGASASIDFNTTPPLTGVLESYNPGARIVAQDDDYSDDISFYSNKTGSKNNTLRRNMTIYANGNVNIPGNLSKGGGSFKIDHPLDPAGKYLYHSFVESPDMMNIYNGIVTLDAHGKAMIQMPEWFQALNSDFRYQLTAVGGPGPNLYVAEEINGNHFRIAGGKAGMKVSWQVTGIRQDAWAKAHRIPVEEDKPANERGYYLHPELFGASEDRQVDNAGH